MSSIGLLDASRQSHGRVMFVVTDSDAAAIRAAFNQGGELSATVKLRRLFPGITDNENARLCVRTIASWQPLPVTPAKKPPVSPRT